MPHTTRVRAQLARHLLENRNDELRRRIAILRETPYPPGSFSLGATEEWQQLRQSFPQQQSFIYGTEDNAVVYTYDASANVLSVMFALVGSEIVGRQ